jgi:hypothetical protein
MMEIMSKQYQVPMMKLNKMMYPKKNQDFQHENVHNNDGMENTDETQGDVEQNNDPFWKVVQQFLENRILYKME